MDLLERALALKKKQESQKIITPEVKIQEEKKIIESEIGKTKVKIAFSEIKLTQDDLWAFHRFLTRKTTRELKKELIPKFIELFKKNL
ncbi:hypothetical protein ES703_11024 [subsurface metagenome]